MEEKDIVLKKALEIGKILTTGDLTLKQALEILALASTSFLDAASTTVDVDLTTAFVVQILSNKLNNEAKKQDEETGSETETVGDVPAES